MGKQESGKAGDQAQSNVMSRWHGAGHNGDSEAASSPPARGKALPITMHFRDGLSYSPAVASFIVPSAARDKAG